MIIIQAPASIMLMGEHAVLRDYQALCLAVNQWITVSLKPSLDQRIYIHSNLGEYVSPLSGLEPDSRFRFVIASIQAYLRELSQGFHLDIQSEFSATVGLGSSAAVTVATLAALRVFLNLPWDLSILLEQGREVVRSVQGMASGADIAASVYGGLLVYSQCTQPERLNIHLPLRLIYSGYKTPTPQVIQKVQVRVNQDPVFYAQCFEQIGQAVERAVSALRARELKEFATQVKINQELMVALGVSDERMGYIIQTLYSQPQVKAAKISGSGLGDCIFALTEGDCSLSEDWPYEEIQEIMIQTSDLGVRQIDKELL